MKLYFAVLCCFLLYYAPASACSPDSVTYRCTGDSFREAVDKADYIIVTRLEEYLPENKGRFEVMMTLRGDIPVGVMVKHKAEQVTELSAEDSCSEAIPVGELTVFMGDKYTQDDGYYTPEEFECSGRVFVNKSEWTYSNSTQSGYPTIYNIINYILGK